MNKIRNKSTGALTLGPAFLSAAILLVLVSCRPEIQTDYQAFREANAGRALYVLNGEGETLSAFVPAVNKIYNNLQTVGHRSGSEAVPGNMLVRGNDLYVLNSGQNNLERYHAQTLDYQGELYLKNGMNPLSLEPLEGTALAFVLGYRSDDVVLVNLERMEKVSSFVSVFEPVEGLTEDEQQVTPTPVNALGDNKARRPAGGAVLPNGADSYFYAANIRYDGTILLADPEGTPVTDGSGNRVRANGYFREGTLSIFSFDASAAAAASQASPVEVFLVSEINLETLYRTGGGVIPAYYPGDGLNPQSLWMDKANRLLHVICTGTNGGETRTFSPDQYIPDGFAAGDEIPGTNPDDGIVLVLNLADPAHPVYLTSLPLGGSPAAFRDSIDTARRIVYLAGVGGLQSYGYGAAAADFMVYHGSGSGSGGLILAGDNPSTDYFSNLLYDPVQDALYVSFFSQSRLYRLECSGTTAPSMTYGFMTSRVTGDGPGTLVLWNPGSMEPGGLNQ